jgi:hypothetical protein
MVLIVNYVNTHEEVQLNRCVGKNEIRNIYVKLKYQKENEPKYHPVKQAEEETYQEMTENYTKFENKAKKYDYGADKKYEEKKAAYNTSMYDLDRKYAK